MQTNNEGEGPETPEEDRQPVRIGENLAPFNPSMGPVIEIALGLLMLTDSDIFYELGCGDGRVMVSAAQSTPGLRCVGIEYDPEFAERARRAVSEAALTQRVDVIHESVMNVSIEPATSAFVYLVPKGMALVAPALKALIARGGRVVSYIFSIPGLRFMNSLTKNSYFFIVLFAV